MILATAFAAECRRLQHACSYQSISPACRVLSSKPASRRCCIRSIGQTYGWTDTRPLHRPCTEYYVGSINKGKIRKPYMHNSITQIMDFTEASGISLVICKSAPRSRQISMPAPHHSVFYRPDALPAAQPTVSKHWRQMGINRHWIFQLVQCSVWPTLECEWN